MAEDPDLRAEQAMTDPAEAGRLRDELKEAIAQGPHAQLALLAAVDGAWAFLEQAADELDGDLVLEFRFLLAQAENQLGRYFGS